MGVTEQYNVGTHIASLLRNGGKTHTHMVQVAMTHQHPAAFHIKQPFIGHRTGHITITIHTGKGKFWGTAIFGLQKFQIPGIIAKYRE